MTNLKPHSYASFDLIRSQQLKTSTFVVLLRHEDKIFSCGILIDSPDSKESGWYLFGEKKFQTEKIAMLEFNRLCENSPVKIYG